MKRLRSRCTSRSAASGLPPSDFRKRPTAEPLLRVSSSCAIAITSFWQIEPPDEVQ
ncbi:MAG: hypothetical protein WDO13_13215 [Verrucomicrobiota bacterium]